MQKIGGSSSVTKTRGYATNFENSRVSSIYPRSHRSYNNINYSPIGIAVFMDNIQVIYFQSYFL